MSTENPDHRPEVPESELEDISHNKLLSELRRACYETVTAVLAIIPDLETRIDLLVSKDFLVGYAGRLGLDPAVIRELDTYQELKLYLTLESTEGFSWIEQLQAAQTTITTVNNANEGLNLETNYDLLTIIKALAAQNNPKQLYANIELMQKPTLVIAPAGVALDNFNGPLGPNGDNSVIYNPWIHPYYLHRRAKTCVYLIEAGNIKDVSTQPEFVKNAASESSDTSFGEKFIEEMEQLGMSLDGDVWAMLAIRLRNQDPSIFLDEEVFTIFSQRFKDEEVFTIFSQRFKDEPNEFGYGIFEDGDGYSFLVDSCPSFNELTRVRVSVMAEL